MQESILRLFGVVALTTLAACGSPNSPTTSAPLMPVPGYEAVEDNGFFIEAVDPALLKDGRARTEVEYLAGDEPGTIVVDTFARKLYLVLEGGRALRYGIAVGREGLGFKGTGTIQRKVEWPSWQPTRNMINSRPDLYAEFAGGMQGGLDNPLGARALYLYRGGRDTYFRIHGTIQNESIGHATSAGCIRLFNQDAIDLFNRTDIGTKVKVRTLEESLAIEGPYMDDAYGRAVPDTQANRDMSVKQADQIQREAEQKLAADAKAAEEAQKLAAKAEKKRLSQCRNKGISAEECPVLQG